MSGRKHLGDGLAGPFPQKPDHLLGFEPVLANQQMNVVVQDRATVTGEFLPPHQLSEGFADLLSQRRIEPDHRMFEKFLCIPVELLKLSFGRLNGLWPVVDFAEIAQLFRPQFLREAPARVVGQPVTVTRKDDMVRQDHDKARVNRYTPNSKLKPDIVPRRATLFLTFFGAKPGASRLALIKARCLACWVKQTVENSVTCVRLRVTK